MGPHAVEAAWLQTCRYRASSQDGGGPSRDVEIWHTIQSHTRRCDAITNSELTVFVRSSLVELRCPCRDVGEVIPVASLRPIRTACKTLGGRTFEHPSCGGFMPTAETTLIPASGNQRAVKRSLTSDARLDNEPKTGLHAEGAIRSSG